jgi:potassium voltage-gated channel Eag-related subfamily H protein 7
VVDSWWSKSIGCRINLVTDLGRVDNDKEIGHNLHRQNKIIISEDPYKDGGFSFNYVEREKVDRFVGKKCMIRVNNPNKTYWEIIVILLAIYNSFSIPIEIAFTPDFMNGSAFYVLNTIIDLVFLADIVVNFRTTYYDVDSGDEVFESSKISKTYMTSRFTVDLLSTIPIDNFGVLFVGKKIPLL